MTPSIDWERLLHHYRFTQNDTVNLKRLADKLQSRCDELLEGFYHFIFQFEHANHFLHEPHTLKKHRAELRQWLVALFHGPFDESYYHYLQTISTTHVRIGLPSHYVNAAFSYLRIHLEKLLREDDTEDALFSLHKILDINLDVLSLSFREKERESFIAKVLTLKKAYRQNGILIYVQPIVDIEDSHIAKYECLMRLVDPITKHVHSINPFLQTAKQIDIYRDLQHGMIHTVFESFRQLPYAFSINLDYDDISDSEFQNFFFDMIKHFPDPKRLTVELLESQIVDDMDRLIDFRRRLDSFGCRIAIDDFGTGYSNLERLIKLQPDFLKIDGSLIQGIAKNRNQFTILKHTVQSAKAMHIKTIAEQVEDETTYRILKLMGVDYVQGYFTGKPFPITKLLEAYRTQPTKKQR